MSRGLGDVYKRQPAARARGEGEAGLWVTPLSASVSDFYVFVFQRDKRSVFVGNLPYSKFVQTKYRFIVKLMEITTE